MMRIVVLLMLFISCHRAHAIAVEQEGSVVALSNDRLRLEFDLSKGSYSGYDMARQRYAFRDAMVHLAGKGIPESARQSATWSWEQAEVNDLFGTGAALMLKRSATDGVPVTLLKLTVYDEQPFVQIAWGVENPSQSIRVVTAEVLRDAEFLLDQSPERAKSLRGGAGARPNWVEDGWEIEAFNSALITYRNQDQRYSMVMGGLGYAEFTRRVSARDGVPEPRVDSLEGYTHARGYRAVWEPIEPVAMVRKGFRNIGIRCWDPLGKQVVPGETYWSQDTSYIDYVTCDPFVALETYGSALASINDAKPKAYNMATLCGWIVSGSMGEEFQINHAPGLVGEAAMAKKRGFTRFAPLAVRLEPDRPENQGWWDDEHWRLGRKSLRDEYNTFKAFADAVYAEECIPFTYIQANMPDDGFSRKYPHFMLGDDISRVDEKQISHTRPSVRMDYSDPELRAYMLSTWKRLRGEGLLGVKVDYPETNWIREEPIEDPTYTTVSLYRSLFELMREGLGEKAFIHERIIGPSTRLNTHVPTTDCAAGIVDLQRVWNDSSYLAPEHISRIGVRWYKARKLVSYYPDSRSFWVPVEKKVKGKEAKLQAQREKEAAQEHLESITATTGKKLFVLPSYLRHSLLSQMTLISGRVELASSFTHMTDEMIHDLTRVFPAIEGTQSARPVDLLTNGADPEIYKYDAGGGSWKVLVVNNQYQSNRGEALRGAEPSRREMKVSLAASSAEEGGLELDASASYHAFEFWTQNYLGKLAGSGDLTVSLRPGECANLNLQKVEDHPQIIGTNRHIMQGLMELDQVVWNAKARTLEFVVELVVNDEVVVTLCGNGRMAQSVSAEGIQANLGSVDEGLQTLTLLAEETGSYCVKVIY